MYESTPTVYARLRYYGVMNAKRFLLYPFLAAALLVSACAGQPEARAQEQTQVLQQTQLDPSNPEQLKHVLEVHPYLVGDRVFFDFDSAALRPEAIDTIINWVEFFERVKNERPDIQFMVEGHADARGPSEYNMRLGCRRANAASEALIKRGFPADRLRAVSFGAAHPAVIGDIEAAWSQNRRAVFVWTREPAHELPESNCSER